MGYEREYMLTALNAVSVHMMALPPAVQRAVRLALRVVETHGSVSCEEFAAEVGGRNWVLARRTRRIVERYGDDVICLTPAQYHAAERRALEKRIPY